MKRLLFSLMIIVAIFSIAGVGGSLAYFSDIDASTDNTFEVGVWKLDVASATLVIENVVPGSTGFQTWTVTNTGTVTGYLDLGIGITPVGLLVDHVTAQLTVNGGAIYPWGPIIGLAPGFELNLPLGVGASADITLDWLVDGAYVPVAGDSVTVDIDFDFQGQP
jgi:predicted ribosomally synthesized peptide with SipW-like signal peptide